MAKTIRQRITIEGAQEIRSALQQIGDAGRTAFEEVRKAIKDAGDAAPRLNASLDKLENQFTRFRRASDNLSLSTRDLRLRFANLADATSTVITRVGLLTAAFAGTATAFGVFVKGGLESVDALGKQAQSIGLTVEQYQGLAFAAQQAGVEQGQLAQAITSLNVKIAQTIEKTGDAARRAAEGTAAGVKALNEGFIDSSVNVIRAGEATRSLASAAKATDNVFADLGLTLEDLQTLGTEQILLRIADAFANMPDGIDKSRIAAALFEKELGARFIPLLNLGADGIRNVVGEMSRFGLTVTAEQSKIAERANDAVSSVATILGQFRQQVALIFAPPIEAGANAFLDVLFRNRDAILEFANTVAQVGVQIGNDFVAILEGRDLDVRNTWLIEARDAVFAFADAVRTTVTIVRGAFNGLAAALDYTIVPILRLFGVEVTGKGLILTGIVLQLTGAFRLLGAVLGTLNSGRKFFVDVIRYFRESSRLASAFFSFITTRGSGAFSILGAAVTTFGGIFRGVFTGIASVFAPLVAGAGRLLASFTGLAGAGRLLSGAFGLIVRGAGLVTGALVGIVGLPALIVAAIAGLAAATVIYWDEIVAVVQRAWAVIGDVLSRGADLVGEYVGAAWDGAARITTDALAAVASVVRTGWDTVVTATASAAGRVGDAISGAWATVTDAGRALAADALAVTALIWDGVAAVTTDARGALATAAASAWSGIETAADGLAARLAPVWDNIRSAALGALSSVASLVVEAWSGATDAVAASAEAIRAAIQRATEIAGDVAGAAELAAQLVQPFLDARAQISAIVATFGQVAEAGLSSVLIVVDNIADAIERRIADLISRLRAAAAEARKLASESSSSSGGSTTGEIRTEVQTFATGGRVFGPGTKTSDSILARLSRGEFVIRAAAVEKYGPGLLAAINGLRFPVPKFATGGLVDGLNASLASMVPLPAFRDGGAVAYATITGKRPVNITIGGEQYPLEGADDVVERMIRHGKQRATAQIGRKPGWAGA